jgi:hypothetical protein
MEPAHQHGSKAADQLAADIDHIVKPRGDDLVGTGCH